MIYSRDSGFCFPTLKSVLFYKALNHRQSTSICGDFILGSSRMALFQFFPKFGAQIQSLLWEYHPCCCCSLAKLCPTLCDPETAAWQAPLLLNISWNLLKFMSTELVMLSNYLNLWCPLLLLPLIFPSIKVFSNESALCIRWLAIARLMGFAKDLYTKSILDLSLQHEVAIAISLLWTECLYLLKNHMLKS